MGKSSTDKQGYLLYRSWTPVICSLSDADAGKLFKAIARYQDGNTGDICNELGQSYLFGIFEMMRITFDLNRAEYDAKCAMRREVGRAGGKASAQKRAQEKKRNEGNQSEQNQPIACKIEQNKPNQADIGLEKDIVLEKDIESYPLEHASLSDPVRKALRDWIEYKSERREGYKEKSLQALVTRVKKAEDTHGAAAVVDLIEESMANRYQGITWDRLRGRASPKSTPVKKNQFTQFEMQQDYDFDSIEKDLL